jgi:hypothetical protein
MSENLKIIEKVVTKTFFGFILFGFQNMETKKYKKYKVFLFYINQFIDDHSFIIIIFVTTAFLKMETYGNQKSICCIFVVIYFGDFIHFKAYTSKIQISNKYF